ncbi:SDR family oxidoreductase [Nocardioides immobilis]|uniref:SDR family oxidoreductase n=1 Tax=Nocardioides immobilis TaxID=2049295 RepID=A0A417Y8Y4_9ACTN|nr:SDR family oxidoreductase [Nocardioides immobilis]
MVLVAGGSGMLGQAIARTFVDEGAEVVLLGRESRALARAAETLSASVRQVAADSRDPQQVAQAFADIARDVGEVDVLVNAAAPSAGRGAYDSMSEPEGVLAAVETKVVGYLNLAREAMPAMVARNHGRIINISGLNVYRTGSVTGTIRNAGVVALSKNLADELVGTGVTSNVVHPGLVLDAHSGTAVEPGQTTDREVAAAVAFLASELAATISGTSISLGHQNEGFIHY